MKPEKPVGVSDKGHKAAPCYPIAGKKLEAALSAGGDKLQFAGLKMASIDGMTQVRRLNKTKDH